MNKLAVIALCLGLAACSKKKPEEQRETPGGPQVGVPSTPAAPAPTPAPAPTMAETPPAGSAAPDAGSGSGSAVAPSATGSAKP
ncbi:MAG TPA: hypothetical protein VGC42_31200 [Kofleriaceae bacterium]